MAQIKISISMDDVLIARIDRLAENIGGGRSGLIERFVRDGLPLLEDVVEDYLAQKQGKGSHRKKGKGHEQKD